MWIYTVKKKHTFNKYTFKVVFNVVESYYYTCYFHKIIIIRA